MGLICLVHIVVNKYSFYILSTFTWVYSLFAGSRHIKFDWSIPTSYQSWPQAKPATVICISDEHWILTCCVQSATQICSESVHFVNNFFLCYPHGILLQIVNIQICIYINNCWTHRSLQMQSVYCIFIIPLFNIYIK